MNFLLVHARNLPPHNGLPEEPWIPTPTNISYKRAAIPTGVPRSGWLETVFNVLLRSKSQVAIDDRIVVHHCQSTGWAGTFKNHFHAGRCMGGLGRSSIGARSAQLRWGSEFTLRLPLELLRPIWQHQRRSSLARRTTLPLLPLATAVSLSDAVGFACGVVKGPGRSPVLVD